MINETERRTPNNRVLKNIRERLTFDPKYVALLMILILAAFLRFWNLESLPPGLQHAEAYNGLDALSLLKRDTFPIFHEGWELYADEAHRDSPIFETFNPIFLEGNYGREPLHVYLTAISLLIFGPTPFAVRFPAALAGVLAVFAIYFAAAVLSSSPKARGDTEVKNLGDILEGLIPLFAAFLVAINYSAITHSRYGVRVMSFVVISTFTVYSFWRGVRKTETLKQDIDDLSQASAWSSLGLFAPKWFIISGILMGLGFYSYAAARFLPLLFVAYGIYWFIRERRGFRLQWANLVAMALAALLVALPLVVYMLRHPYFLIFRSRVVANRGAGTFPGEPWKTWSLNVGRILWGLIWQGDTNILQNLPGRAFIDPIQLFFAFVGLANIVARKFKEEDVFLLLWLFIMLLPGVLSGDAPHFGRLIGIVPPLAIIMARGVVWIGQLLFERTEGTRFDYPQIIMLQLMLLLIASGGLTVVDYFWRYANSNNLDSAFDSSDWELGQYVAQLPEESTVYIVPTQEEMATIYFAIAGDKERLRSFHSPGESLLPYGHEGVPAYYILRPDQENALLRIADQFNDTQIDESVSSFITISRPSSGITGVSAAENPITWGGAITLEEWMIQQEGEEIAVTLIWQAKVQMSRTYTAFVHLLAEDGTLVSQLDRPPDGYPTNDWQPGEYVRDVYRLKIPDDLTSGKYVIQTGFYHFPTAERLGEPEIIDQIDLR